MEVFVLVRSAERCMVLLLFLSLSIFVNPVAADTSFPDYHQMNNRVNALSPAEIPELTKKAQAGDRISQIMLGLAYQNGHGVHENHVEAFSWYQKAADQGSPMGENLLGLAYYTGNGVGRNDVQAVAWFRKASKQMDYTAQDNLATVLKNGGSLPKDTHEAKAIVEKEAQAGGVEAQIALGLSYGGHTNRLGIHKDYNLAAEWLKNASDQGSPIAQANGQPRKALLLGRGSGKR
jgi:TPR repeat protein